MKQIYLLSALMILGGSTFSQRAAVAPRGFSPQKAIKAHSDQSQNDQAGAATFKAAGDTVFYDDFANGLAGNNGVGAWTVAGPDGALWMYDTDGPNGDFSDPSEIIASTTVANGFMMFDSNFSNDGCTNTNTCVVRDGWLESPVLDLSATPFVHLILQQRFRWCCSTGTPHFVDVSTDGGSTYPTRIALNADNGVNIDNGTTTIRVSIGAGIAADPSNVKIRISHDGSASGNVTHYHWQIDDVAIVESEGNDLALTSAAFDNHIVGETTANYEYTEYPFSQVREFTMKAKFNNEGANIAYNAEFKAVVYDAAMNVVWTDSSSIAMMDAGTSDSLEITGFTPAMAVEDYTVEFFLSSDSVDARPDDNMGEGAFSVSEFSYGMDQGARDGEDDNAGEAYYLGNTFWIENDVEITGIQVAVASGDTDPGSTIAGILLDANLDPVDFTDDHEILSSEMTSNNNANWITLMFGSPVSLFGGEEYLVAIQHFGGTDNIAVATSGTSLPFVSLIYDEPIDTWFYVTGTPMVRPTFNPSVGIEDNEIVNGVGLGQNFPNPYTNTTAIPYSLENTAEVSLEIYDVTGKIIMSIREGKRAAGNYRVELNASDLVSGIYYYTLVANNVRVTKKMTILE